MSQDWLEAISDVTDLTPEQASVRLRKWGIVPDRPARPARSITLDRIAFSGEKKGKSTGAIDFEWADLGPGVWAVTSDRNLVGKSTVLEIVLWCLRGSTKNLQPDVRGWLAKVCVDFSVDKEKYRVTFDLKDDQPVGRLERRAPGGKYHQLDGFASDDAFALTMSRFMMDALDLDILPAMQGDDGEGRVVEHGWSALSNALYFGGNHNVLLGETASHGLPARTLQMYVGLPWAGTKNFVTTAKKEIDQKQAKQARTRASLQSEANAARARLETELIKARGRLAGLPMVKTTAETLCDAGEAVATATRRMAELRARAAESEAEAERVRQVALDDERTVRDLRETIVATRFFNGLNPECCPRCETKVPKARVSAETTELACSLCAESISEDRFEDVSETLEEAETRAIASKAAVDRVTENAKASEAAAQKASEVLASAQKHLDDTTKGADFAARRVAELDIARLEGALDERSALTPVIDPDPDAALIEAAAKETEKAYEAGRKDILNDLSAEILILAQRLGISALEKVALSSNSNLKVWKGGAATSFSKVTPGERLRLRLATAIALLRVGRELGIGRHPGLLIIDSPAAEEVYDMNLQALLGELRKIAKETYGLQVLVAGANRDEIVKALGEEHCRIERGDGYVW